MVSDTRRKGDTSWRLSAQVEDFTAGSSSIEAKYLGWQPKVYESGGDAVAGVGISSGFDLATGQGLGVSRTLAQASSGHAAGDATVGADLNLKFPLEIANDLDRTFWSEITFTLM
uniref:CAZy families CE1 protein n=1 Tax=uncultured Cellulomonas sp. TaxID=189682 RepID=A0A060C8B5_9CELL|nr:CAZy families CE1 protein [uncultured Cellulomonas sp.]